MRIRNATRQEVLAEEAMAADNFWRRLKGLLGTKHLAPGAGLVIRPCSSVHTFGMNYAIDVLFVNREDIVTKIVSYMKPGHLAADWGSRYVIELPAGTAAVTGIQAGDRIELSE